MEMIKVIVLLWNSGRFQWLSQPFLTRLTELFVEARIESRVAAFYEFQDVQ